MEKLGEVSAGSGHKITTHVESNCQGGTSTDAQHADSASPSAGRGRGH